MRSHLVKQYPSTLTVFPNSGIYLRISFPKKDDSQGMQISKSVRYLFNLSISLGCLSLVPGCGTDNHENQASAASALPKKDGMIRIPAGTLHMGGDNAQADPNEFPKHDVAIHAFWMDETEVTNTQFDAFVKATGYTTVAERKVNWEEMKQTLPPGTPQLPDSVLQPGALVFHPTKQPVSLNDPSAWWTWTNGANWRHPEGPGSSITDKMDHPVVQICWEDAMAYVKWAGKRLPTEAEWEWAARGGLTKTIYPWGNDDPEGEKPKANFWQGLFPYQNSLKDGYFTTAPVKSFPPNGYGLYDMAGNVWEWCSDWFDFEFYKNPAAAKANTKGPEHAYNPYMPYQQEKVMRGGSFLCNDDYCSGYRNARRMGSSPDTGLNHAGFRCVRNAE
ncbi:MAG: formylglycine-generating enzyme family protein [Saprospiraceae bacterium]|nr:formylglycine-generating enzyme family protein [Saprospiraceae bacterium]